MKEFIQFFSVMIIFALVAGFSPKAEAVDTSDVIIGIIGGGILGAHIERNKDDRRYIEPFVTHYPHGTIIVPGYRTTNRMTCYWNFDPEGYTTRAIPDCVTYGNSSRNRYSNRIIQDQNAWPCGSYWGLGCRKLIRKLKSGEIEGVFDFTGNR